MNIFLSNLKAFVCFPFLKEQSIILYKLRKIYLLIIVITKKVDLILLKNIFGRFLEICKLMYSFWKQRQDIGSIWRLFYWKKKVLRDSALLPQWLLKHHCYHESFQTLTLYKKSSDRGKKVYCLASVRGHGFESLLQ